MEKIKFVSVKDGARIKHATLTMFNGVSVAVVTVGTSRVLFGIPGGDADFIEVCVEPVVVGKDVQGAIDKGVARLTALVAGWADTFDARTLNAIRNKELKPNREYTMALLSSYKAYNHKDWKPT